MVIPITKKNKITLFKAVNFYTLWAFAAVFILPLSATPAYAQNSLSLPSPGQAVTLSPLFRPTVLAGMKMYPDAPFRFDFIVDEGDAGLAGDAFKNETEKLVKYFLASLTIPEQDLWVNLSPYEKDRIAPGALARTELGRDLLAQDYLLKQITASLVDPQKDLGKDFWDRVYQRSYEMFGTTQVPVSAFHKVWIVPQQATIFAQGDKVFVTDIKLNVMLEEDYVALQRSAESRALDARGLAVQESQKSKVKSQSETQKRNDPNKPDNALASSILREIVIPQLEREVNEGKNFAPLRQICHSLVLAVWFKRNLKETLLAKIYADQGKIRGVDAPDPEAAQEIYAQYLAAYQKGAARLLKVEYDKYAGKHLPRQYFSGGFGSTQDLTFKSASAIPTDSRRRSIAQVNMVEVGPDAQAPEATSASPILKTTASADLADLIETKNIISWQEIETIFGPGVKTCVLKDKLKINLSPELERLAKEFWQDPEVLQAFDNEDVDSTLAIVRFLVRKNVGLKDLSLKGVSMIFRSTAPKPYQARIHIQSLTVPEYISFLAGLKSRAMQDYLDAVDWEETLPHERIYLILRYMQELGIPLARLDQEGMDAYSLALPLEISDTLNKKMILNTKISYRTMQNIIDASDNNEDLKEFLRSDEFIFTPVARKDLAFLEKLKELNLVPATQKPLESFQSYLNVKLASLIFSDEVLGLNLQRLFGDKTISWLKKHQPSLGSPPAVQSACRQFLADKDFLSALSTQEKIYPLQILRLAIAKDIVLGTPSLRIFIEALRKVTREEISDSVSQKIRNSGLAINDYMTWIAGLEDPRVQSFAHKGFQEVKEPYRLVMLLREIQKIGVCFTSGSIIDFYSDLPDVFAGDVSKRSVRSYLVNVSEAMEIKKASEGEAFRMLVKDKSFQELGDNEKLIKMYEFFLTRAPLEEENDVPKRFKMFLTDVLNNFEAEDGALAQIRAEIFGEGIEDFLIQHKSIRNRNDEALMAIAAKAFHEDRRSWGDIRSGKTDFPTALIRFAVKHKLDLGTCFFRTFIDHYRKKFPEDFKETKVFWNSSFRDLVYLRSYLADPQIQRFINEDLRQVVPWERLIVLLEKMEEKGLVLEKEYLAVIAASLPPMLSPGFSKEEMRITPFLRSEYYQMKKDFNSLKKFLMQGNIRWLPLEQRIGKIWKKARDEGLLLGQKDLTRELTYLLSWFLTGFEIDHADADLLRKQKEIFGNNVHSWMKRHYERSKGIPWLTDITAKQFWQDASFLETVSDEKESLPLQVVRYAIQKDADLGTPSLMEFFDVLKKAMPQGIPDLVRKRFYATVEISANEFIDFYSGLFHPKTQDFLRSPEFLKIPQYIRMACLWEEMERQHLPVPPGRFSSLLPVMPQKISETLTKKDFGSLTLDIKSVREIRAAVLKLKFFISSENFRALTPDQKIDMFLDEAQKENIALDINVNSKRLRTFLNNIFSSVSRVGIESALGIRTTSTLSLSEDRARIISNGNGSTGETHVIDLGPEDFQDKIDFNGKGRMLIEEMTAAIDTKKAEKKIARVALALSHIFRKDDGSALKVAIVYGVWPKDKGLSLYLARILKAYGFDAEMFSRPEQNLNINIFLQEKIKKAGPDCPVGIYIGTSSDERAGDRILLVRHAQHQEKTDWLLRAIESDDANNRQAPPQTIVVVSQKEISSTLQAATPGQEPQAPGKALTPGGIDLNAEHFDLNVEGSRETPAAFTNLQDIDLGSFQGLRPLIINIIPSADINAFFGLAGTPAAAGPSRS